MMSDDDFLQDAIIAAVTKKEYSGLSRPFIIDGLREYLRLHPAKAKRLMGICEEGVFSEKTRERLERAALFKEIVKHIRSLARDIYGIYHKNVAHRTMMLAEKDFDGLLSTHLSTRERLPYYDHYHEFLAHLLPNLSEASVMDLACGLNPLALTHARVRPASYIAVEWSKDDADFLDACFRALGWSPSYQAHGIDLVRETEGVKKFSVDLCIMLKTLDALEMQERNMTYRLLDMIGAPLLLVSFTTVNVRQQPLDRIDRSWFEKVCVRKDIAYEKQIIGTELFYVCRR